MKVSDAVIQKMRAAAEAAAEKAYCPYSKFPVGAAVLTEEHEVFVGCNVENASPSGSQRSSKNSGGSYCYAYIGSYTPMWSVPTSHQ